MTSRRNMKATLAKVEESISRLRKVRASLMSKIADHDVITDYKDERKKDLEFQKGKQDSYFADTDRVMTSSRRKRAEEEKMPEEDEEISDIEAALDELEDSEEEVKCADDEEGFEMPEEETEEQPEEEVKAAKIARARSLVARMDRVADKVQSRNPKLAARIDAISNTLEKKYRL
jgi:hypothetical protein